MHRHVPAGLLSLTAACHLMIMNVSSLGSQAHCQSVPLGLMLQCVYVCVRLPSTKTDFLVYSAVRFANFLPHNSVFVTLWSKSNQRNAL